MFFVLFRLVVVEKKYYSKIKYLNQSDAIFVDRLTRNKGLALASYKVSVLSLQLFFLLQNLYIIWLNVFVANNVKLLNRDDTSFYLYFFHYLLYELEMTKVIV